MLSTSLFFIGNQFSIYVGLLIFIFGIIGNLINLCLLFSNRSNSCSFLLFISSFFNIIALSSGLLPRVLSVGFNIDPSSTNIIWCKCRLFLSYIGTLSSLTCICFAAFDRFLVSCRSVAWRNRSKLSTAKIATLIAIVVIVSNNMPILFFYTIIEVKMNASNTTAQCSLINPGLDLYLNYFVRPILVGLLPSTILIIIGWLTYRNITSVVNVQLRGSFQRGLTSMILLQSIIIIIPIAPFAILNIYQAITSSTEKTSYRLAQETLIYNITNIILYISYASNFYIHLISASSYRRDFVRFIRFCYHRNNRIKPIVRK